MMDMREETLAMLEKIGSLIDGIEAKGDKGEEMLTNMKAYVSDSRHFLENGNQLKAFEAAVWAWAVLEICEELGVLVKR